jgi:SNF2 family DNA or RNA helicase
MPYTRSIAGERAIILDTDARHAVLRKLADENALQQMRQDGESLFGERSFVSFSAALYSGDLALLSRESQKITKFSIRGDEALILRELLREAVLSSLAGDWWFHKWGEEGWRLVDQVLSDALVSLSTVYEIYEYAVKRCGSISNPRVLRRLVEHSFLRGDSHVLEGIIPFLPTVERAASKVMLAILEGKSSRVQSILDELVQTKGAQRLTTAWPVSVTVMSALFGLSRNSAEGKALVKQMLSRIATDETPAIPGWPRATFEPLVVRAFRSLMRRLSTPTEERLRLSPHQQGADSPSWETLLFALTVHLENADTVTRLGWSRRLFNDGTRWQEAGYLWIARQAFHLAKVMSPEPSFETTGIEEAKIGEILLSSMLEREPEYRIALNALERFADSVESKENVLSRRVTWYVDMTCGELAKPALEEYREGVGWTRGQRVDLEALRAVKDTLPAEDRAVLLAIDATPVSGRVPPEALEALCGHSRVFNGARGRQPVEVVRGHGRVETRQERGHLVIQVEPSGAKEGVHVVIESESRLVVYRIDAAFAKLIALLPTGIRIPQNRKHEGLAVLSRLSPFVEVRSDELGAFRSIKADSSPCLRISSEAGAWWIEVGVRPFGELGRFFPPGLGRSSVTVHGGEDLFESERNLAEECERFHSLVGLCPTLRDALAKEAEELGVPKEGRFSVTLGEEELFTLIAELREGYPNCPIEWKNSKPISSQGKLTSKGLQGSLKRTKGWYIVDGSVKFEQINDVTLAELLRMPFTKTGRFLRLPSGDFVEVEKRVRQVLAKLASVGELSARGTSSEIKIPEVAFDALKTLLDAGTSIEVERTAREWLGRVDATLASEPPVPDGLQATLRPYQIEGYQWLRRYSLLGMGVCLADDMGLGKTLQIIALLLTRVVDGPALVVAPTSVCSNWLEELNRFAPSLTAVEYTGRGRSEVLLPFKTPSDSAPAHVIIVSYALLQQDAEELAAVDWNTVVLDEAQFIKNPHSLRAKAAYRLNARYKLAMTGTPVENHLGDLWSIFHFIHPSLFGSLKHFQLRYVKPIERDKDSERQSVLKKLVQPFLLRRRKDEVLKELPPITTLQHFVRLNEDEAVRYAYLRKSVHEKLYTPHGKRENKIEALAEITRLRRFCCHPRLVFPDAPTDSSKVQSCFELVTELRDNGHRALVFSQFVDFLELVREQLDERGIKYLYLDGSTPKEARQERVKAFQSGTTELFLISLKAGGFGLNLTGADYVIHLDPWWNPAVEAQATDRVHRIGQERPVTVYRLVTKDSIEERIVELHREKRAIADALLDGSSVANTLSEDELLSLLRE